MAFGSLIQGQTHEWVHQFSSSRNVYSHSLCMDEEGNSYMVGIYEDSLSLDTHAARSNPNGYGSRKKNLFWVSFDTAGKVRWLKTALSHVGFANISTNYTNPQIYYSKKQKSIYILGYFKDSVVLEKTKAVHMSKYHGIFKAKIGVDGKVKDISTLIQAGNPIVMERLKFDKDGTVALGFTASQNIIMHDDTNTYNETVLDPGRYPLFCLAIYSSDFSKRRAFLKVGNTGLYDFTFMPKGGLNVTYSKNAISNKVFVVNKYFTFPDKLSRSFIIKYHPSYQLDTVIKMFPIQDEVVLTNILSVDSGKYLLTGFFQDSLIVGHRRWKYTSSNKAGYFIGLFQNSDSADWIKISNSSSHSLYALYTFSRSNRIASFDGKFIFNIFLMPYNSFVLGGDTLDNGLSYGTILKIDRLGNPLWALGNSAQISDLIPDNHSNLIYNGDFVWTLDLAPFKLKPKPKIGGFNDGFIAKIADYALYRGGVREGPYCAGDTIVIPYTKYGNYDTANYFIAELSDEYGEFSGSQRELGRIKSNQPDSILGKLPLFQVTSSEKYRIRVRSTHPKVQSYYKLDTLQLLIYSRDKADPGLDTTICHGDSIQLETFGGTKWTWSPSYSMDDSTLRTPLVWPDTSQIYQIIIADSSGCGAPDTAEIKISILEKPTIHQKGQSDTLTCLLDTLSLWANFKYGKGDYICHWFNEKHQLIRSTHAVNNTDTLSIAVQKDSSQVYLILTDSCSDLRDTAYFGFGLYQPVTDFKVPQDTFVCSGSSSLFVSTATHQKDSLVWIWLNSVGDTIHSTSRAKIFPVSSGNVHIQLYNQCNLQTLNDSFKINLYDSLQSRIQTDKDTICRGELVHFSAISEGGNPNESRSYSWKFEYAAEHGDSSFYISVDSLIPISEVEATTKKVYLTTTDGCSIPGALDSATLLILSPLKQEIDVTMDTVNCLKSTYKYNFSGIITGGKGKPNLKREWKIGDQLLSSDSSFVFNPSNYSHQDSAEIYSILNDGCSTPDTTSYKSIVYKGLEVQPISDTLICFGSDIHIDPSVLYRSKGHFSFAWMDRETKEVLSTDTSLYMPSIKYRKEIQLVLKDYCSTDTLKRDFDIGIQDSLQTDINASDICSDHEIVLTAQASGGVSSAFRYEWYEGKTLLTSTQNTMTVKPGKVTKYGLVLKDNCSIPSDTSFIQVAPIPTFDLSISDTIHCEPYILDLSAQSVNGESYSYHVFDPKNMRSFDISTDNISFNQGSFPIWVYSTNILGCRDSQKLTLTIKPRPDVGFSWNPKKPDFDSALVYFKPSYMQGDVYNWFLNNKQFSSVREPSYLFEDTARYEIKLHIEKEGCENDSTSFLKFRSNYRAFNVNSFSPNGDGINDVYKPFVNGIVELDYQIYNRWGELIFKGDMKNAGWDGSYRGKQSPDGLYIVLIRAKDHNNKFSYFTDKLYIVR